MGSNRSSTVEENVPAEGGDLPSGAPVSAVVPSGGSAAVGGDTNNLSDVGASDRRN